MLWRFSLLVKDTSQNELGCLLVVLYLDFLHTYLYSKVCLMSDRIVLKANKMMIMVLLNVLERQILVDVCCRFIDV